MDLNEPVIQYKVFYKLNPEYKGAFQKDKLSKPGLHGTFGEEAGGFERAEEEAIKCKRWFNEDKRAVEKLNERQRKIVEVHTKIHDNVIVWIEKWVDGKPSGETVEWDAKKGKRQLAEA